LFPTNSEVDNISKSYDDLIGLDDVVQLVMTQIKPVEEHSLEFEEAFKVFDLDGNGYISCEELKRVLTEMGEMKLTDEEVEEIIDMVDVNNDNRINYTEFVHLLTEGLEIL